MLTIGAGTVEVWTGVVEAMVEGGGAGGAAVGVGQSFSMAQLIVDAALIAGSNAPSASCAPRFPTTAAMMKSEWYAAKKRAAATDDARKE